MNSNPSVLAVVPARRNSKQIPGKNLVPLSGLPLIAHTLRAISAAHNEFDHIVSTDSKEIAEVAARYGGQVPQLRPAHLAQDDTNIVDVLLDVHDMLGGEHEYTLLLQPTAPLRRGEDIDAVLDLAFSRRADSVCSFMEVTSYHPWYMYYRDGGTVRQVVPTEPGRPRQQFPEALWRNGAVYLTRTAVLQEQRAFITQDCVPYVMPAERSVNIDTYEDLELAEYYLEKLRKSETEEIRNELRKSEIATKSEKGAS